MVVCLRRLSLLVDRPAVHVRRGQEVQTEGVRVHKGELLLLKRPRYFLLELLSHRYSEEGVAEERHFEILVPSERGT